MARIDDKNASAAYLLFIIWGKGKTILARMRKPGEKNPDELMVIRKRKREGGGRKCNPDELIIVDSGYRAPSRSYRQWEKNRDVNYGVWAQPSFVYYKSNSILI